MFLRLLALCQEIKSLSSLTGLCHIQCLHGEVLFECKAPAFVSTIGSVYLKNRMCSAPWKGWDVCRSQPCCSKPCPGPPCCQQGKNTFLEVSARHSLSPWALAMVAVRLWLLGCSFLPQLGCPSIPILSVNMDASQFFRAGSSPHH